MRLPTRLAVTAATMTVAAAVAIGSPAQADVVGGTKAGDTIHFQDNNGAEVSTDRCGGANVRTTLQGGPYPNPTNVQVTVDSSYASCMARARIVYATPDGTSRVTEWADGSSGGASMIGVTDAFRCYTEFQVRRFDNDDWLTLRLYNPQVKDPSVRPAGCAAA
ncbi:hypothetical protein IFT73_14010 [Aeromicrobium sp. CFBP 8757]|uniref:hypothetical protein n=1 Tax=Aeromicrobium sp. CFBP 8757 TaxID=2775288 RepID=UPI001784DE44|nr:hypothetical protein [Aeromicrobium sp. CFBP 8757]MBD8607973.1 hypothetical protein [Aeromicrobium sp. CFBP 8757]